MAPMAPMAPTARKVPPVITAPMARKVPPVITAPLGPTGLAAPKAKEDHLAVRAAKEPPG